MGTSDGFVPMVAKAWPIAVERFRDGEPWESDLAEYDLRWWADYARMKAHEGVRFPGRPFFSKRWGWSGHKTGKLMADREQWADIKGRTKNRQPADSRPTARRQPNNGATLPMELKPTAGRQPADSSPTAPTTLVHSTQNTEHVWAVWRSHHPRCRVKPSKDVSKLIGALLSDLRSVEDIGTMIDWCHAPGSWWVLKGLLRTGTILKMEKSEDRITQAAEWHAAGRPDVSQSSSNNANGAEDGALKAWSWSTTEMTGPTPPEFYVNRDPAHFRIIAAIDAVGFDKLVNANQWDRKDLKPTFLSAHRTAKAAQ